MVMSCAIFTPLDTHASTCVWCVLALLLCFSMCSLDSICRYIESKAGELGLRLAYNIDGHLTGRRRPNGSMPCWILLYADDMVIFEKSRDQMRAVLAVVHQALEDWGMQMSISKTKYHALWHSPALW